MGRVVQEDQLLSDDRLAELLVAVSARASALAEETFLANLQALVTLLPDLKDRLLRLQSKLLVALVEDVPQAGRRLIELKGMLPMANVSAIVVSRPALLLDEEFNAIPGAVAQLRSLFNDKDLSRMVESQPLLLVEDITAIIQQLESLMPGVDVGERLKKYPNTVLQLQRGTRRLGPGAEF
ncbi:hypothetical protein WJX72_009951 [[Myrmecia] bisecta]|uniref:Uncharacterized protein n=1 Tax=[Myrmecia] bisecta TaxID=41462 RepID=A0AAW1PQK2_9CHLO